MKTRAEGARWAVVLESTNNKRRNGISSSDFCRYWSNKEARSSSLKILEDSLLSKEEWNIYCNHVIPPVLWYFFSYLMGWIVSTWFYLHVVTFWIGSSLLRLSELCLLSLQKQGRSYRMLKNYDCSNRFAWWTKLTALVKI